MRSTRRGSMPGVAGSIPMLMVIVTCSFPTGSGRHTADRTFNEPGLQLFPVDQPSESVVLSLTLAARASVMSWYWDT